MFRYFSSSTTHIMFWCPPPPCACPEPETVSLGTRLLRAFWFLTKLGLFVGVAQFTIDEGLWGTGEETEDLARRMGMVQEEDKEKKEEAPQETGTRGWWDSAVLKVGEFFGLEP